MSGSEKKKAAVSEASLLAAVLFLGTNPVAVKYVIGTISPLPFAALRFTSAGILLFALTTLVKRENLPKPRDLLALAGIGVLGVGLNNSLFTLGVSQTTASETALLYATPPLWGMLLAFSLGLERPNLKGVLGIVVALLGVLVVVYGGLGEGESTVSGSLLVTGGAVCWGSYTVLTLRLLRRYSPLVVATYTILAGGLAVAAASFPNLLRTDWGAVGPGVWAAAAYTIGPVAAYGFWAWQSGVRRLGANRVLIYQYLVTLVGVAAGIALLGENLQWNKIVGGAIILLGVYLARR